MPTGIPIKKHDPTFVSRADNLRVVRAAQIVNTNEGGQQRQLTPGLSYQFEGGLLTIDDATRVAHGRYFERYKEHYDPDTLDGEWLPADEWLRRRLKETGNGYELAREAPSPAGELARVAELAIDGDEQGLLDLRALERDGWQRPAVLDACKHALAKLKEKEPSPSKS